MTDEAGNDGDARIVAFDAASGLALLGLAEPWTDRPAAPPTFRAAELHEVVHWVGHGGTPLLGNDDAVLRALASFTSIRTRVVALPATEAEPDALDDLLVDRSPGTGDRGAPLLGEDGAVVAIVDQALEEGGGRARAISARRIEELLAAPRLERPYMKRSHLQFWSGTGVAAHNRPSHLAATASIGFRVAVLDHFRIEPWFEALIGFRAASTEEDEDEDGNVLSSRPTDLWWSLEAGVSFGYRIPVPNETSRDYVIPNVGVRLGWNKFEHRDDALASDCSQGPCAYVIERNLDRVKDFRPGIDLGLDVRHGKVRIGYRFFLDPTAVQAHSMHRVFVTFDGIPLPIRIGDSN